MMRTIRKTTRINTWYKRYPRTARERVARENKMKVRDQLRRLNRQAERGCLHDIDSR